MLGYGRSANSALFLSFLLFFSDCGDVDLSHSIVEAVGLTRSFVRSEQLTNFSDLFLGTEHAHLRLVGVCTGTSPVLLKPFGLLPRATIRPHASALLQYHPAFPVLISTYNYLLSWVPGATGAHRFHVALVFYFLCTH